MTTSNTHPDDLYRDGLQRQRFLPAIAALHANTRIVEMSGDTDYRLRLLQQAGTYLVPADAAAFDRLSSLFAESASTHVDENHDIDVNGRPVHVLRCAKGIAWFDFADICEGPRSQADYIEIARWYPTVIITGVPELNSRSDDAARRFIALVDEFYDRRVKLIIAADRIADRALYRGAAALRIRTRSESLDRNAVQRLPASAPLALKRSLQLIASGRVVTVDRAKRSLYRERK